MKTYNFKKLSVATVEKLMLYMQHWDYMPPIGSHARKIVASTQWITDDDDFCDYLKKYKRRNF